MDVDRAAALHHPPRDATQQQPPPANHPADQGHPSAGVQRLHQTHQPRILRSTRLADLVTTVDAKLVAAAYGMTNEAVTAYLADHVDAPRLPNL